MTTTFAEWLRRIAVARRLLLVATRTQDRSSDKGARAAFAFLLSALTYLSLPIGFAVTLAVSQTLEPRPGSALPEYPARARRLSVAGDVTFRARVAPEGRVEDVFVLSVPGKGLGFEEAVRDAVLQWRFEPAGRTRYHLGEHRFELRPEDEKQIRLLAENPKENRFHDGAAVFVDDRVHRKADRSSLDPSMLSRLSDRVRSIDFSAGEAATVTLQRNAVVRVLKRDGSWLAVTWEDRGTRFEPPEKIRDFLPVVPRNARGSADDDLVILQALIDDAGIVRFLAPVGAGPDPAFVESAMTAASAWRFRPALREGAAVPYVLTLTVGFRGEPF